MKMNNGELANGITFHRK